MSRANFIKAELASGVARGVRQCVLMGLPVQLRESLASSPDQELHVITVGEAPPAPAVAGESLASTLEKAEFDKEKPSLFVWLGGAGYRTLEAVLGGLGFIASLPKGSGVVFDYVVERTSLGSLTQTTLDALASRVMSAAGVQYLIQPQAVVAMLRGLGFQHIVDVTQKELSAGCGHLVSAVV